MAKCNKCGIELTEANTSKAYKHICKDCYAKMMQEKRANKLSDVKDEETLIKCTNAIIKSLATLAEYSNLPTEATNSILENIIQL